uniref:Uncharacterized protein TCIL3000_10_12120 n=1 Tax=Trypanosoma congolense (strain IL3000) TaxID=1068625 RepID=G0UYG4_TRYCI|nr:unnamed protein product [Trypanosoma congolense IL3000]
MYVCRRTCWFYPFFCNIQLSSRTKREAFAFKATPPSAAAEGVMVEFWSSKSTLLFSDIYFPQRLGATAAVRCGKSLYHKKYSLNLQLSTFTAGEIADMIEILREVLGVGRGIVVRKQMAVRCERLRMKVKEQRGDTFAATCHFKRPSARCTALARILHHTRGKKGVKNEEEGTDPGIKSE